MEDKFFDSGTSDCFGYIHLRFFVFLGIICAKLYEGYAVILQSSIEICGDFKYEDDYFQFVELKIGD